MRKLSRKPVRRGKIYCSSACGHGCLWEDCQVARQLGENMRLSMKDPKQWHVSVWENLGRHVCLEHRPTNALLAVWPNLDYPCRGHTYRAMLSLDIPRAGDMDWSNSETFRTPQKAVDYLLSLARKVMARRNAVMAKLPV